MATSSKVTVISPHERKKCEWCYTTDDQVAEVEQIAVMGQKPRRNNAL